MVEMDADGSHQPEQLPRLLARWTARTWCIGSRWVPGGKVLNWPKSREVLSRGGNIYTRIMLGISIKDATGGYRAYRASTLRAISLDKVESRATASRSTSRCGWSRAGLRIVEVPITFVERERGASKMSQAHHRGGVLAGGAVGRQHAAAPAQTRLRARS